MSLPKNRSSEMAQNHPQGAKEFDGVYFHGNECSYYHAADESKVTVYCKNRCGYKKPLTEMKADDNSRVLPPFCPECYKNDEIHLVRTHLENPVDIDDSVVQE